MLQRADGQRLRGAAGLHGLGLRQRLQHVRPHLPGDGAGRRRIPSRPGEHQPHPRAQQPTGRWCRSAASSTFRETTGPDRVPRYNLFPAVEINGQSAPGVSSGQALARSCRTSPRSTLPPGIGLSSGPSSPTRRSMPAAPAITSSCSRVLFVFLVLAAQYESWSLPLAVILIVPMCLLSAVVRRLAARAGHQHLHAGRLRGAGRAGRQERHPDRRVRARSSRTRGATPFRPRWRRASCGCGRS